MSPYLDDGLAAEAPDLAEPLRPTCDQLAPKDLNFCPDDERPLAPLNRPASRDPEEEEAT